MCECEVYHDVEHFLSSDVHNLTDYAFHVVCDKNIFFFWFLWSRFIQIDYNKIIFFITQNRKINFVIWFHFFNCDAIYKLLFWLYWYPIENFQTNSINCNLWKTKYQWLQFYDMSFLIVHSYLAFGYWLNIL